MFSNLGGGGENVKAEVDIQAPLIAQILQNLGFTADSASGTNKQKLQTNNANLAKIEDYLPHGAYVWKKSIYIDNKDITINVLTTSAPSTMKAVSSDYDLSQVDESFFVGYVGILNDNGTNTRLTFKDGGVLLIEWGTNFSSSSNNTYSYNPSTQVITISSAWSTTPSGKFSKDDETEFIEFVVSDVSTAYPDGDIKDGYWYEKMGIDLSVIGITKSEVNEFIFSSNTSTSTAISHSLGKEPKIAILFTNDTISKGNENMAVQMSYIKKQGSGSYDLKFGEYIYWYDGSNTSYPPVVTVTDSSIVLNNGAYYQAGKKYTLVTMG